MAWFDKYEQTVHDIDAVIGRRMYIVHAVRDDSWWLLTIPELGEYAVTQARTLTEAPHMVRDYIAVTLDADPDSFDFAIDWPGGSVSVERMY